MATAWQRGATCGLALLLCSVAPGETNLRDLNYVLVEYSDGSHRLLTFSPGDSDDPVLQELGVGSDRHNAMRLLRSDSDRERVRGLLLLSGETDQMSLDLAMALLTDASDRVREEAEALVADHPLADDSLRVAFPSVEDE